MQEILDLVDKGAWLAVAALVIGLLATAAKRPAFFGGPLARIPRERRPYVIAGLGLVSGVLEAVVRGVAWSRAIVQGVLSAGLAMLGHGLAGGVSPEPAAPQARGDLPAPAAGLVVDTTLTDASGPRGEIPTEAEGLPVPPDLTPTPDRTGALEQPVVDPSETWGPSPSPRPSNR